MQCIWKGSLRNVLDNIKLCVIIENLHLWAMNHLRPWLSSCIDQWKRSIDDFQAEDNCYKPERSSEKQPVKPNQSKPRVPLSGTIQLKRKNLSIDRITSNHAKTRISDLEATESLRKLSDLHILKARSSFGGQTVLKGRPKKLDTHSRSNFALRRANTLESCLDQDDGHASSDETAKSSEEEGEEESEEGSSEEESSEEGSSEEESSENEESEEEQDDDYVLGSEEEEDEAREENIDIALERLKKSLRHDRRGRNALDVLLGYWCQLED
jgi:hypothetical protein